MTTVLHPSLANHTVVDISFSRAAHLFPKLT